MKKRILVVDDDPGILEMMEEALSYSGFQVKAISGSVSVFSLIDEFQPDLILIDYLLQDINGGEICYQVKRNPETSHLPVVIISAYTRVLFSLGTYNCDAVLPKPFGLDELLTVIHSYLPVYSKAV